jgi:5-formyltetrahydrofolate cyclo-ligase
MDEQALKAWRTQLRGELVARRIAADPAQHAKWSATIESEVERLLRDVDGKIVSFCWPYQAEFDTRPLILRLLARGARTALPIVVKPRQPMIFREWTPETKMVAGVYDIPVPIDSAEVVPDIALIPLAGFDDQGYRLGYGGGFFDRTLAALAPGPLAIGVGFELARVPTIYPQPYDVPLDYVVTELGLQRRVEEKLVLETTRAADPPRAPTDRP